MSIVSLVSNALDEIQDAFYGSQTAAVEKASAPSNKNSIPQLNLSDRRHDEVRTARMTGGSRPNMRVYHLEAGEGEFVTSMRLSDWTNVLSVRMDIGGMRYEEITRPFIDAIRAHYGFEENEIPFGMLRKSIPGNRYHDIRIYVQLSSSDADAPALDYNVKTAEFEDAYSTFQDVGWAKDKLPTPHFPGGASYRLHNYNEPSTIIWFDSDSVNGGDPVLDLHHRDGRIFRIMLRNPKENHGLAQYDLTDNGRMPTGINLGATENIYVHFHRDMLHEPSIGTIGNTVVRKASGMMGLALRK